MTTAREIPCTPEETKVRLKGNTGDQPLTLLSGVQLHAQCVDAVTGRLVHDIELFVIKDPQWLILSEVGVGIAWASILAMPYAILASSLPQAKLGIYMGLFNVFVVLPQLLVATVMGSIMKAFFPDQPICLDHVGTPLGIGKPNALLNLLYARIKADPAFAWGVPELVREIKPEEMDIPITNKR